MYLDGLVCCVALKCQVGTGRVPNRCWKSANSQSGAGRVPTLNQALEECQTGAGRVPTLNLALEECQPLLILHWERYTERVPGLKRMSPLLSPRQALEWRHYIFTARSSALRLFCISLNVNLHM